MLHFNILKETADTVELQETSFEEKKDNCVAFFNLEELKECFQNQKIVIYWIDGSMTGIKQ